MKTLDMAALRQIKNGKSTGTDSDDAGKADFRANRLHCVITDAVTGKLVMETVLEPRGFKASENKKTGAVKGGIGWYQTVKGDDGCEYQGFPVNAGLRVSVDKIKVEPDTSIDLRTDENGEALKEGDED